MNRKILLSAIIAFLIAANFSSGQNRIHYHNHDLFLSGSNLGWVNYSSDFGPRTVDFSKFDKIFNDIHAVGGNSMRLWIHTDGTNTPEYGSNGMVTGPGVNLIADLKEILSLAQKHDVGLVLSIWSFNMVRNTINPTIIANNKLMLNDTTATMAYIRNALIPIVDSVKGNPAIIAWEIFNEPEGMTKEFGWSSVTTADIPMANVQRFVNLAAAAIHRTDPTAKVTNGTNNISTNSDVTALSKISADQYLNSLSAADKEKMVRLVQNKYGVTLTPEQIMKQFYHVAAANKNYYTDARLIAAGGDPLGTLDFYTVHYYNFAGGAVVCPFTHPYSFWNLDKPLYVGEFYMDDAFTVPYSQKYETLYKTGYAGAMSWSWNGDTQESDNNTFAHTRTDASLQYMYENYHNDIVFNTMSGVIYKFVVSPASFQKGESCTVTWDTETGSGVTLNGETVSTNGSRTYNFTAGTSLTLITTGDTSETKTVTLNYIPPGTMIYYKVKPK